jgi:hypothetical protein
MDNVTEPEDRWARGTLYALINGWQSETLTAAAAIVEAIDALTVAIENVASAIWQDNGG